MKIALCTTQRFVPPLVGGVDVYTDRLGRALKRLGHDIFIIALDSAADKSSEGITVSLDKYWGTKIWRLEFSFAKRPREAFHLAYDPEMGQVVKNILAEQKPDLFIIMNFYMLTLAPVKAAKDLGIPVAHVVTDFLPICRRGTFIRWDDSSCRVGESVKSCSECFVSHRASGRLAASILNRLPEDILIRWAGNRSSYQFPHPLGVLRPYWNQVATMEQRLQILRSLRHKIDLVLAPTQYTLEMFLANGFKPEQVIFLPFGVEADHPPANIEHIPAPHSRFLFVGRLQPYKGAHLLIEAFANLKSPREATLTIYGAPDAGYEPYFNQLEAMMATNKRIRFGGKIALNDLGNAFAEADYFVLPSTWHENSPLILLDALQSKTPVIASDIGGVTDMIKDGVNGLLFPPGDRHGLQRVMQRVIDQPALREQLSSGASLPSVDNYARTVIKLYRERLSLPATEREATQLI